MPAAHGRRLAALMPRARYAEIPGAYVLSMLDEPEAVAREMGAFLTTTTAPARLSGHGLEVAQLVGVEDDADGLDLPAGDVERRPPAHALPSSRR